ncbi:MAG TPA: dipeptidase [Longimicrobiaceae bacterium]
MSAPPRLIVAGVLLFTGGCAAGSTAGAGDRASETLLRERAERILADAPLIDGHNDFPSQVLDRGGSLDDVDLARPQPALHTDLSRLRAGRVGGQFWSAYVSADSMHRGALRHALRQIDLIHRMIERYPELEDARTAADLERIGRAGGIASMIGVEGGHAIEGSLSALRVFHELGVRYMTLTHSLTTDWADSGTDEARHGGLSPFGEEVVREMNRLGMFVDLSHVSPETMRDALRVTRAPVLFSHSSARGVTDQPRNVPDDVLRELARNGGVIMVTFVPQFVNADPAAASLADVANHIDHIRRVAGIDHIGIGGDFDGISSVPEGLEDVSDYPALFAELLRRGYSEEDLRKISRENVVRAMRQMEEVADRLRRERPPSLADRVPAAVPVP